MDPDDDTLDKGKQALRDIKNTLKAGAADVGAQARSTAAAVGGVAAETAGVAREVGAEVGRRARRAAAPADVAIDDAEEVAEDATHRLLDEPTYAERLRERAEDHVRAQPLGALAIAAAIGVLFGAWLRGQRR